MYAGVRRTATKGGPGGYKAAKSLMTLCRAESEVWMRAGNQARGCGCGLTRRVLEQGHLLLIRRLGLAVLDCAPESSSVTAALDIELGASSIEWLRRSLPPYEFVGGLALLGRQLLGLRVTRSASTILCQARYHVESLADQRLRR